MKYPTWFKPVLLAPCILGAGLLAQPAFAASLVPPQGYYAPVDKDDSKPRHCSAPPKPYTAKLEFRSKYEGSDKARATLNKDAEKAFRDSTAAITEMERGVNQQIMEYMREGHQQQLQCALQWLGSWAQADALLSTEGNHTGKSIRKWALGSLSSAYLRLKFSESRPLAPYAQQSQMIESWFVKMAEQTVTDWSDLPLKKINNHSYWAAWSVMATAVATDRRDLFDWSVDQFRIAANQVDDQGYLPNELKRRQRALAYHNYALPPLAMVAAFAKANGVDLREENNGALKRLAERVMQGVDDEDVFQARTDEKQDMEDLEKRAKFAWLEPYCSLYACSAELQENRKEKGPFKTFRLGGDVTQVFDPNEEGGS
ncbi:mannuronate-specific alginate lyase [Pseudomonas sp. PDM14]|uniref:mannuronate-specific alginate lyase n=1 Tax=Pseudomonas sp. PDM14 TaxID=2769288 RepID=UPI0017854D94|nr:mannuronate-specific alginate lyase [Pseudomonas sp. PDM14]MBD9485108.1 mannuronate-specific alginate lyase [Pseudomonas sp. PDM14]